MLWAEPNPAVASPAHRVLMVALLGCHESALVLWLTGALKAAPLTRHTHICRLRVQHSLRGTGCCFYKGGPVTWFEGLLWGWLGLTLGGLLGGPPEPLQL